MRARVGPVTPVVMPCSPSPVELACNGLQSGCLNSADVKGPTPKVFILRFTCRIRRSGRPAAHTLAACGSLSVTESFFPAVDGTTTTVKAVVDRLVDTRPRRARRRPGARPRRRTAAAGSPGSSRASRLGTQVRAALESFAPDLVHVTSPDTVGRKALKHARRLGMPHPHRGAVARLRPDRRPLAHQGRRPLRPGPGDRQLDARPARRPRRRRRRSGRRASTRRRSARSCATPGCTTSWARARSRTGPLRRGRVRRQPAPPARRTPPRRAGAGARHPPGADRRRPAARLAAPPGCPARSSPAPLETGDLTRADGRASTCWCTPAPGDLLPRAARGRGQRRTRRRAALRWRTRRRAATSRPGCSTTPPTTTAWRAPSPRWPATGSAPCWARAAASSPYAGTGATAVDELVEHHYAAARRAPTRRRTRPDLGDPPVTGAYVTLPVVEGRHRER